MNKYCVPYRIVPAQEAAPTTHILSLESFKRNNVAYIEDDMLITSAGSNVIFLRLPSMEQVGVRHTAVWRACMQVACMHACGVHACSDVLSSQHPA